jgi:hypothetical protein
MKKMIELAVYSNINWLVLKFLNIWLLRIKSNAIPLLCQALMKIQIKSDTVEAA